MNDETVQVLADRMLAGFSVEYSPRRIGREAEFLLGRADGTAGDARAVLLKLLEDEAFEPIVTADGCVGARTHGFDVMTEVGTATIEIVFAPVNDLFELDSAYQAALARLERVTQSIDQTVMFAGVHPGATPGRHLMTGKARYQVLSERAGPSWMWFTVTASDQTHIDIRRNEAADVFQIGNRLTPVVLALCGNSPGARGTDIGDRRIPNARESRMAELLEAEGLGGRHGMFPPDIRSVEDYVRHVVSQRVLALDPSTGYSAYDGTFADWDESEQPESERLWTQFLFHEHYVWPSARLRTRTGTIEFRAACQQPREEHNTAAALHLGIVEGWRQLQDVHPPSGMRERALLDGLALPDADIEAAQEVLGICEGALRRRGRDEEMFLRPLFDRLAQGMNPGQRHGADRDQVEKMEETDAL